MATDRIIALDPSSTCIGVAVLTGSNMPEDLVWAGRITPSPQRAPALLRAVQMAGEVVDLIKTMTAACIVIEMPGSRPPRAQRGMATKGQANYGMAVGIIYAHVLIGLPGIEIRSVPADKWTRAAKQRRAMFIAAAVPGYEPNNDKGRDVADAIELGLWAIEQGVLA